jgi:hypothetical protein
MTMIILRHNCAVHTGGIDRLDSFKERGLNG